MPHTHARAAPPCGRLFGINVGIKENKAIVMRLVKDSFDVNILVFDTRRGMVIDVLEAEDAHQELRVAGVRLVMEPTKIKAKDPEAIAAISTLVES